LSESAASSSRERMGFIFDLDGTLIDSVYQHVLAWHDALSAEASSCRSGAFTGRSA
jgi:phosphoserine phosphatase